MKRGEIWWAALPPPAGSGLGFKRPVLILQSNAFNDSRISTVIVAVVTSNLDLAAAPGNVRLAKSESGLSEPSVIDVSQVLTIDKVFLTARVRALPGEALHRVEEGLRLVLGV
jgi:mRNA interferase MazF